MGEEVNKQHMVVDTGNKLGGQRASTGTEKSTFSLLPITTQRTLQACRDFDCDEKTVFVCSYPKSGTTWLQNIVFELVSNGKLDLPHISDFSPFYEAESTWKWGTQEEDRGPEQSDTLTSGKIEVKEKLRMMQEKTGWKVFNTHLLPSMLPLCHVAEKPAQRGDGSDLDSSNLLVSGGILKERNCGKYVYITREAKDACVSFYYHLSHQYPEDGGYTGSLDAFVEDWIKGKISYGSLVDHVAAWKESKVVSMLEQQSKVLFVQYEDMKASPLKTVETIARFLGLKRSAEELQQVVKNTSFEVMKANLEKFQPRSVRWIREAEGKEQFTFIRKGKIGDAKKVLSAKQAELIDEMMRSKR